MKKESNTMCHLKEAFRFLLSSVMFIGSLWPVSASPFFVENLNVNKGLSNNYVTSIAQDRRGFIYVGTENGLNRFDGHSFRHYYAANTSMAGDNVTALLYETSNDRLWVGTKSGLYVFQLPQMTLEKIPFPDEAKVYNINDLRAASDGGIWITNHFESVTHYDPKTGKTRVYSQKTVKGMPYDMLTAVDDGRGNLYVGHYKDGISVIDMKSRKIRNIRHNSSDPASLPSNRVRMIFCDSFNNIWMATSGGLALKSAAGDSFKVFRHSDSEGSLAGNAVYALMETPGGDLWVGSDIGGISMAPIRSLMESDGPEFTGFVNIYDTNDSHGVASRNIRSIFRDSYGNVWVGNFSSGLDFIPHRKPPFERLPWFEFIGSGVKYKSVWSVAADRQGEIWAGGDSEIARFKDGSFVGSIDLMPYLTRYHDRVEHIAVVGNRILIGLDNNGVLELSPDRSDVKRIPLPDVPDGAMNSFTVINDSMAMISSENGVYVYTNGRIEKPGKINSDLEWTSVNSMVADRAGNLWVGTNGGGIRVYDINGNRVRKFDKGDGLSSNVINQLILDSRGNIWGASGNGVFQFKDSELRKSKLKIFGLPHGMTDSNARAIAEDMAGDIWITTGNTICRWNRSRGRFEIYDHTSGLPVSSFMPRAIAVAPDSTLYFGSLDGMCRLTQPNVGKSTAIAPVVISGCASIADADRENGYVYSTGSDGRVEIPYDRNSFRITFSIPDYSESRSVDYYYMMEGLDKEWHSTNGNNSVIFRNLRPGSYTFRVKGKPRNGDEETVATLRIRVNPPVYLRWYFIALYAGVLLFLLWMTLKRRERRIKQNADMKTQLEITKNRQRLNDERLRFYTDISHELRTPLTLILGPSEDLKHASDIPEKYSGKIDLINYNARNLLMLISQMLELHKTETASRRLSVRKDDISALVTEIALRFKEYNRNDNVRMSLDIDRSVPPIYYDRKIVSSILNNLVSNALKYTKAGGVTVGVRKSGEDDLEIFVSDTGIGISEKDLPHLFERFYRVDENSSVVGTGIGLSLSKTLADLHHASLTVESREGEGSVFRLWLKISETYPDALHKDEPALEKASEESQIVSRGKLPGLLVVEDNADIRDYVRESFHDRFRVETACDGEEGLQKAREFMPDMIISDIMMPRMNGVEMCRRLKSDFSVSHIPVLLLTAKDSIEDREVGYAAGAVSYITKPFSASLLITRVDNIIEANRKLAVRFSREGTAAAEPASGCEDSSAGANGRESEIRPHLSRLDREFLMKLKDVVLENLSNPKFGMPLIAERFNMSNSTLYRKISVLTGSTAVKHIRNIRLQRTRELIDEGYSVSEAAFACGFNDLAYFRTCFKEYFGMSPSQYKKRQ